MAQTHYLIDYDYWIDQETLYASMGHLLVYVPGAQQAKANVTVYFEDREPMTFGLIAPAGTSTESNYTKWPVAPNSRFALQVETSEATVCQATVGWNNSANDYSTGAKTKSAHGVRECARSYMAITQLSQNWYLADGLVLDNPSQIWVRESEWAYVLNPGEQPTPVVFKMQYSADEVDEHKMVVPGRRLGVLYLDDIVRRNRHYGMHIYADRPIAAQWMRVVKWDDDSETMTFWSVPCASGL